MRAADQSRLDSIKRRAGNGMLNNHRYPKITLAGRWPEEKPVHQSTARPTEPKMAAAASSDRKVAPKNTLAGGIFPIRGGGWQNQVISAPEDAEYIALCRRMADYSVGGYRRFRRRGRDWYPPYGVIVPTARRIQLIRFQEMRRDRASIEKTKHLYPDTAEEVASIFANGSPPKYTSAPPKAVPGDGYPHNKARAAKILESMWGDIIQLKAFVCDTKSLIYGEPLEYIPTATVPNRLPDRKFSAKSRTISDLRRANLGIDTEDFFPIWLPEIKHIAERAIRTKRQNPGILVKSAISI